MKKDYKKIKNQSIREIEKEIGKLRGNIAKEKLSIKTNPPKDVNALFKKRKLLAVYLTVLTEKRELEQLEELK